MAMKRRVGGRPERHTCLGSITRSFKHRSAGSPLSTKLPLSLTSEGSVRLERSHSAPQLSRTLPVRSAASQENHSRSTYGFRIPIATLRRSVWMLSRRRFVGLRYYTELGIEPPAKVEAKLPDFEAQVRAA